MLQNTGQNVQEIDAAKCIDVILKNAQCPIDQRTKAISAVQSSWQTTRVTLIHTILTKIQSSFFQFMWQRSVIQWGKNPVVVVKRQDDNVKRSNPQNPKEESKSSTKRKSRQDAKEDRALVKKLKEDNAIAVRTDRQQSELRALNAGTVY